MTKRYRLTESTLRGMIQEAIRNVLKEGEDAEAYYNHTDEGNWLRSIENDPTTPIFTLDAYNITGEYGMDDMQYCGGDYTSEEAAIEAARQCARSYANNDGDVVIVTVFAGEYEDENGNIKGEPYDIYTVSNSDKETTMRARKQSGFMKDEVDEYMG